MSVLTVPSNVGVGVENDTKQALLAVIHALKTIQVAKAVEAAEDAADETLQTSAKIENVQVDVEYADGSALIPGVDNPRLPGTNYDSLPGREDPLLPPGPDGHIPGVPLPKSPPNLDGSSALALPGTELERINPVPMRIQVGETEIITDSTTLDQDLYQLNASQVDRLLAAAHRYTNVPGGADIGFGEEAAIDVGDSQVLSALPTGEVEINELYPLALVADSNYTPTAQEVKDLTFFYSDQISTPDSTLVIEGDGLPFFIDIEGGSLVVFAPQGVGLDATAIPSSDDPRPIFIAEQGQEEIVHSEVLIGKYYATLNEHVNEITGGGLEEGKTILVSPGYAEALSGTALGDQPGSEIHNQLISQGSQVPIFINENGAPVITAATQAQIEVSQDLAQNQVEFEQDLDDDYER